jgi:hypothetical protein
VKGIGKFYRTQLIRRVLGHSDGSVTAIDNRYGYVREMRASLEAWANELLGAPVAAGNLPPALEVATLQKVARNLEVASSPLQLPLLPPGTRLS